VSSNVFKGTFDLINKVSVFFPLTTLIEKLWFVYIIQIADVKVN
jgi:hypothetical protein